MTESDNGSKLNYNLLLIGLVRSKCNEREVVVVVAKGGQRSLSTPLMAEEPKDEEAEGSFWKRPAEFN